MGSVLKLVVKNKKGELKEEKTIRVLNRRLVEEKVKGKAYKEGK